MIVFHDSPCIRICRLDSSNICVGCYRTLDEITDWHKKEEQERLDIFKRCAQRKSLKVDNNK